jgi:tetratricopeptide (TPR) repeat protein
VELPYRSHAQFPGSYSPGFPGLVLAQAEPGSGPEEEAAREYLAPERTLLYRAPGMRAFAAAHRRLVRRLTEHFVGIRQEEHARFLATTVKEGRELARLVERGTIPPSTHIAIDCVGAIPYYSRLRTLDRLGLTDAEVARGESVREMMAHGKRAEVAYGRERGVDLWAMHPVHLLWDREDPDFYREMTSVIFSEYDGYFADAGGGHWLLAHLSQGKEDASRRFPALELRSVFDHAAVLDVAEWAFRTLPRDAATQSNVASSLFKIGEHERSLRHYRAVVEIDPRDSAARNNLATALAEVGELSGAAAELEEAIRLAPGDADVRANYGRILLLRGEAERAREQFVLALRLDPESAKAKAGLAAAIGVRPGSRAPGGAGE